VDGVQVIGEVRSVNVGAIRRVEHRGRQVSTGIWKEPVVGPVAVRGVNLEGDDQADRRFHGGPDKAVYAYAVEDYAWWASELGHALALGAFGENLTVEGVDLTAAVVGERWLVGTCVLEVRQPRTPCWKLGLRMGDDRFPARFLAAGRPGAYLRIAREGELGAGDELVRFHIPDEGPTMGELAQKRARGGEPASVDGSPDD
jgi:MOSC domain-containing protein YiiM